MGCARSETPHEVDSRMGRAKISSTSKASPMAKKVVCTGEGWLTELSTADLKELFKLRKEAVAR